MLKVNWKRMSITIIVLLITLFIIPAATVSASDSGLTKSPSATDLARLPGLSSEKYGVCTLDNVLDPTSPNYAPDQRYGAPGSRFNPTSIQDNSVTTQSHRKPPFPGDGDYGTTILAGNWPTKLYATQQVSTSISLSDTDDYLYAPTVVPPDYGRLEVLAYYHYNGSSMERFWKIFSHSTVQFGLGTFVYATQINSTFCTQYAPSDFVTLKMECASLNWSVYLWNYVNSTWDYLPVDGQYSSGYSKAPAGNGWDAWEQYDLQDGWPTLPKIRSSNLMIYLTSLNNWVYVTTTYGNAFDQLPINCPLAHNFDLSNYDFYVGP